MSSPKFNSPVNLRKNKVPVISIYGDDEQRSLTKLIWEAIPGFDVRLANPSNFNDLLVEASESALVFICVKDANDENVSIASKINQNQGVVADIIAITSEPDVRKRLHMLSTEYDSIYNLDIIGSSEFSRIFLHKLKKGITRLEARVQEDEYTTFLGFLSVCADAFIVFDRQRRIFYVSGHYLELYPRSEPVFVRGTPVQKVFDAVIDEMGVNETDPQYHEARHFWTSLKGTHEIMLDNGTHLRMTAVDLPNGQGTIVSTTNVTVYKNQEKALATKQMELERALSAEQEASNLQKQFISMVSHEFRTPLSIVDGNAQILERRFDEIPREEIKTRLHAIRSAVSRTVNMMEAVLSSNLLKTGKLDIRPERFNLEELIEELCREQRDLSADSVITTDYSGLDGPVFLDKKIITLVLTNILANAVKYTNKNPHIHVKAYQENQNIILSVKDNGIGIPQDEQDKIFQRFYRGSTSGDAIGSGIGLSLVRDVVQIHGGHVKVDSQVENGSIFTVFLPKVDK